MAANELEKFASKEEICDETCTMEPQLGEVKEINIYFYISRV